jgi:DNA-binding IclR family transcriptional regulator
MLWVDFAEDLDEISAAPQSFQILPHCTLLNNQRRYAASRPHQVFMSSQGSTVRRRSGTDATRPVRSASPAGVLRIAQHCCNIVLNRRGLVNRKIQGTMRTSGYTQPGQADPASGSRVHQRTQRRPASVMAVRHAIDVVRCLSSNEVPLGVSEIARRIGLHKSSVSRLLATLEDAHLVERDRASSKFKLGVGIITLAAPLLSNLRLLDVARPYLEHLAKRSGETISLNIWDGAAAVSVEQVPGGNAIQHYAPPGMRNPAHCTAAGKALLAHASGDDLARILSSGLRSYTPLTTVDNAVLEAELKEIRQHGYALNAGELVHDVGAVACVVRDLEGKVVAAVTATVPMYRFTQERRSVLISLLTDTVWRISQRLGYIDKTAT